MADVPLDTLAAEYGLTVGVLPGSAAAAAYTRLVPANPRAATWWAKVPVTTVELPTTPLGTGPGQRPSLVVGDTGEGLRTAQAGVNNAHAQEFTTLLAAGSEPPPVHLARVRQVLWIVDGVHRLAAAIRAGRPTHRARVVDLLELTSCPCGWTGSAGSWVEHPCPARALPPPGV